MSTPVARRIVLETLEGLPLIRAGDDLAAILSSAIRSQKFALQDGDILAVAQKIVSKAEGRTVDLSTIVPSERARELAQTCRKPPALVEVILRESREVIRARDGILIVETHRGMVMANAGVDQSNIQNNLENGFALLLPQDADASAEALRQALETEFGKKLGVIILDSIGRAWREATIGTAIGVAGMPAVLDYRGGTDLFGRELKVARQAFADSLASAASVLMGEGAEGYPAVLIQGLPPLKPSGSASDLVRSREIDLFR